MFKTFIRQICSVAMLLAASVGAHATFHLWVINEIYSNADGSVQFVELSTTASGQQFVSGHSITCTQGGTTHTFNITSDLPGDSANKTFLIGTQGFAALNVVTPDYVVPNGFLFTNGGTLNWAGFDSVTYSSLPTDGRMSINHDRVQAINSPKNFAGATGSIGPSAVALENPQPGSFQSGIGLISGWSCQGPTIAVSVDGGPQLAAPYGSSRNDTAGPCGAGNTNTGFGLLINYNLFGAGSHSAQLFVNGTARGTPTQFTVTTPGGEFLTGVSRQASVPDFPSPGKTTVLIWQESQQNFAIKSVSP
jgi:hypothetical protein